MDKWIAVVTSPLGLAAFALFLVFTALAKSRVRTERTIFAVLAAVTLVSAIGIAAFTASRPKPEDPTLPQANPPTAVQQITEGANSPAVANTRGSVTIEVNQPPGAKGDGAK
jgi:hypothetical protein